MSTRSRVIALLVAAPLLLVVGALGTAFAWLADGLSQYNDAATTTAQYGVAFIVGVSGAISLLIVSRHSERLRRAGMITGATLTGLAVLVSGLPFVSSIAGLVYTAVQSAKPLTDEEKTSITELRAQSDELFDDIGLHDGESSASSYGCLLGNLDRGEQLSTFKVFHLEPADKDDAVDAIQARWQSLGYDVDVSGEFPSIKNQAGILSARVSWYSEAGNLSIDVTSICVVKD